MVSVPAPRLYLYFYMCLDVSMFDVDCGYGNEMLSVSPHFIKISIVIIIVDS